MATYTLEVQVEKRSNYRAIMVRPTSLIRGLRGGARNYPDPQRFADDLAKYLSYTAAQVDRVLESESLTEEHQDIELSDMDAAYFGYVAENTKRLYIYLKAEPASLETAGDQYTIAAQTRLEEPLTRAIPVSAGALLELLRTVNPHPDLHFIWSRHLLRKEPFRVITVPDQWEAACVRHGVELPKFTLARLPAPAPLLVFAGAIRTDSFTPELEQKHPARYRHTCSQCDISYELVVELTAQGSFDQLPDPSLPHFEFLRRRIDAAHPDHAEARLGSAGRDAFFAQCFTSSDRSQA